MADQQDQPTVPEAFFALVLALRDATGEVERSSLLYGRENNVSEEDWARMESTVHAVGDKLRDLQTVRREAKTQAGLKEIEDYIDSGFARDAAGGPVDLAGWYAILESGNWTIEHLHPILEKIVTVPDRRAVKQDLADRMRAALGGGDMPSATRLADLNKAATEIFAKNPSVRVDKPEVGDAGTGHGAYEFRSGN